MAHRLKRRAAMARKNGKTGPQPPERYAVQAEGMFGLRGRELSVHRLLICLPTTGTVRFEWAMQFASLIYPVNWSQSIMAPRLPIYGPMGFAVAGARNACVREALAKGFDWIFFLDQDVIPPANVLLLLNEYLLSGDVPLVSGVYYQKGEPSYPLVFRGRGNGAYLNWKRGEKVWVDGVPMGCALIHTRLFEHLPQVPVTDGTGGEGWFDTPRFAAEDPETGTFLREVGTEDLHLCTRLIEDKVLAKAGWPALQKQRYPFLVDSRLWCAHIDGAGRVFPTRVPKPGVSIAEATQAAADGAP